MTNSTEQSFRLALVHELTALDEREARAEVRRRLPINHHRIAHYLSAASAVAIEVEMGNSPEVSFACHFNPTAGMHGVAKRLGLRLDVRRGEWVAL